MVFTLWKDVNKVIQKARKADALNSLNTSMLSLSEGDLHFHIHILESFKYKTLPQYDSARSTPEKSQHENPFLPHEEALFVTNVGHKHKCLLNKYNVVDEHILLVTQAFEAQSNALNEDDFLALHQCMCVAPAFAFYNSGKAAGGSQLHKHLQLIHMPNTQRDLISFNPQLSALHDQVPSVLTDLPFRHAALALPKGLFTQGKIKNNDGAVQLQHLYDRLRMTLDIEKKEETITSAYNLLLTHDWMLMVPRVNERFANISLNALAFSGSILVKTEAEAQKIIAAGLSNALRSVS